MQENVKDAQQLVVDDATSPVNLTIAIAQDGSCAVLTFSLFSVFQQQIVIPRNLVLQFMRNWVDNEKKIQDVGRVIANIRSTRND